MTSSDKTLKDKIVLMTAAATGIGRVVAENLHGQGATLYIGDISTEALNTLPDGDRFIGRKVDVSDAGQVEEFINVVKEAHGRLDILINNAGVSGPTQPVENTSLDDWHSTLAVDLDSVFFVTKYAVPLLKASSSGVIVNMSSSAGLFGVPLRSAYVAAKWAIIGLTKTWAMELGPLGIRVNALCPGSVEGERIDRVISLDASERNVSEAEIRRVYKRQSSLRRFVTADDIAAMVSLLVGDSGRNISGQAISIDGNTEGLTNWLDD